MNLGLIMGGILLISKGVYALPCIWVGSKKSPYKTFYYHFFAKKKELTQNEIDLKNYVYGFGEIIFGIILVLAGYKGVW